MTRNTITPATSDFSLPYKLDTAAPTETTLPGAPTAAPAISPPQTTLSTLPEEVQNRIFSLLSISDILNIRLASKTCRDLTTNTVNTLKRKPHHCKDQSARAEEVMKWAVTIFGKEAPATVVSHYNLKDSSIYIMAELAKNNFRPWFNANALDLNCFVDGLHHIQANAPEVLKILSDDSLYAHFSHAVLNTTLPFQEVLNEDPDILTASSFINRFSNLSSVSFAQSKPLFSPILFCCCCNLFRLLPFVNNEEINQPQDDLAIHVPEEIMFLNGYSKNLTPLAIAILHSSVESVQFLLNHGANINSINCEEFTPLDLANRVILGVEEMEEMVLEEMDEHENNSDLLRSIEIMKNRAEQISTLLTDSKALTYKKLIKLERKNERKRSQRAQLNQIEFGKLLREARD